MRVLLRSGACIDLFRIGIDHIPLKESLHKINNETTEHMKEVCESDWDIQ